MRPGLPTRLLAAALILPLLVLATATGGFGLRCRITGVVLNVCCCGEDAGELGVADAVATVSPDDCCDRVVREVTPAPAELTAKSAAPSDPASAVAVVALQIASGDLVSSPPRSPSESNRSIAPPTVRFRLVAKSAFLI